MSRRIRHALLLVLVPASVSGQFASADVAVRFDPPTETRALGEIFTMDIVADIPDPVTGWGLDMTMDDELIASQVGSPAIGPAWAAAFAPDGDELAGLAFPDSVSGTSIILATITFSADAIGFTDLLLGVTPGDLNEGFALDPSGFADISFEPGRIQVVPEPASLFLLAALAAPAFAIRRRIAR